MGLFGHEFILSARLVKFHFIFLFFGGRLGFSLIFRLPCLVGTPFFIVSLGKEFNEKEFRLSS